MKKAVKRYGYFTALLCIATHAWLSVIESHIAMFGGFGR